MPDLNRRGHAPPVSLPLTVVAPLTPEAAEHAMLTATGVLHDEALATSHLVAQTSLTAAANAAAIEELRTRVDAIEAKLAELEEGHMARLAELEAKYDAALVEHEERQMACLAELEARLDARMRTQLRELEARVLRLVTDQPRTQQRRGLMGSLWAQMTRCFRRGGGRGADVDVDTGAVARAGRVQIQMGDSQAPLRLQ